MCFASTKPATFYHDMKTQKAISILLVLFFASFAHAQTLWHGTHYGMGYDEVRKKFPDSRDSGLVVNGHKIVGPLIDTTTIGGYHFTVTFMFTAPGDRLDRVSLKCTDKLMNAQGAAVGRHFVELLQSQYGVGTVGPDAKNSDPNDIEMVWITPEKTQISLSYFAEMSTRNGTYQMVILYDGKRLQGASDL